MLEAGFDENGPVIEPDTKDWTWVLDKPCADCGFVAADVDRAELGRLLRDDARGWAAVLAQPGVRERPDEATWSGLEYACHVRDVHRIFAQRLDLMLEQDEPAFGNWDQDATAVEDRYDQQDPAVVGPEVVAAAEAVAARYDALVEAPEETWARRGLRSDGSRFTVDSIARYHLHDVRHHSHDVRELAARATVAAYAADAAAYRDATSELNPDVRAELDRFAAEVGRDATVLEIGSAGGRDARVLEEHGLAVRRTDVTSTFVELIRSQGYAADLLDPLTDDLGGPYDGVWANACLLHVSRADLPVVLRRLAGATRVGGVLAASVKEGDGEEWSAHGHVSAPRRFTYWRAAPWRAALEAAGWRVEELSRNVGPTGQAWLRVRATRTGR